MAKPLLEDLEALLRRPVPQATRTRAARHVLDWIGCAVAGAATPAGAAFRAATEPGEIAVLGQSTGASRHSAALTMGALGNPLEMDDVDRAAILHPGPVVIPAALVAAQAAGASPAALLDGIVRGYDAMIRLGRTVGPGHYAQFHTTSTCGPLGAAVAVADILRLDPAQTVSAMGNAVTQAAGFWAVRHEDVMAKQLHTAHAAAAGLSAALLARAGLTGAHRILEGPQGFFEGMCPDPTPKVLLTEPEAWRIHDVSFKPWPACRHCHPAIDAALILRAQVADPSAIAGATVTVYADAAKFCDRPAPGTSLAAKFSLQHAVAVTLLGGRPTLDDFEAEARARADIRRLCARTEIVVDAALTAAYPAHFGTGLTLHLTDGAVLTEWRRDAFGDPELPMDDAALMDKARALMRWGGLGTDPSEALIAAAFELPEADTLTPLRDAFTAAVPHKVRQIA